MLLGFEHAEMKANEDFKGPKGALLAVNMFIWLTNRLSDRSVATPTHARPCLWIHLPSNLFGSRLPTAMVSRPIGK